MRYPDGRAVPPRDLYADIHEVPAPARKSRSMPVSIIIGMVMVPILIAQWIHTVRDACGFGRDSDSMPR